MDMPVVIFDDEDLEDLSVERISAPVGGAFEGSFRMELDVEAALQAVAGEGEGEEEGEEGKEETLLEVPLAIVFHPLPGAYGYYTLKGKGFPQRVRVYVEEKEAFGSCWGFGWEKRPLYALYLGKDLDMGLLSGEAIEEELMAIPCEYDPATGEVSFEAGREGDYCFVSMKEGETAGEALFQQRARELLEQVRLQIGEFAL